MDFAGTKGHYTPGAFVCLILPDLGDGVFWSLHARVKEGLLLCVCNRTALSCLLWPSKTFFALLNILHCTLVYHYKCCTNGWKLQPRVCYFSSLVII